MAHPAWRKLAVCREAGHPPHLYGPLLLGRARGSGARSNSWSNNKAGLLVGRELKRGPHMAQHVVLVVTELRANKHTDTVTFLLIRRRAMECQEQ